MFAVIYRFHLKEHQETQYQIAWDILAHHFIQECGALGSCLHRGADGLWVAYSRWPDKQTRDAVWSDEAADKVFPAEVQKVILFIKRIQQENQDLPQYDEICLEVMNDKLGESDK